MNIWVDLANSPHVPFFRALIPEFESRGYAVSVTARDFAQTVELAEKAGLTPTVIGAHGGRELSGKAGNLVRRAWALRRWARGREFDLAVSHNSYSQIVAARSLGIRTVTLMDYEHQPANHLAFRLAHLVVVPRAFPDDALRRFGASAKRTRRYDGIKEDVYLADFTRDPSFDNTLRDFGVGEDDVLVVVRPPATEALYHRFKNELFELLLDRLAADAKVKTILLARTESQRKVFEYRACSNIILPRNALDGSNLIAAADLVISAGGTMNREAAALGTPCATIYAGKWAAIDEQLLNEKRLRRITGRSDVEALRLEKKCDSTKRHEPNVKRQVVELILDVGR